MGVFNTLEAAIRFGVPRFVNVSSETVPGFFFPERPFLPDYVPVDEEHPIRPQDPYATAKHFSELLMDAAMRRSDIRCLSIRPSWVQWEGNYDAQPRPAACAIPRTRRAPGFWSYIDVYDLADALVLAAESDLDTHEVFYIASPDNNANRPLADLIRHHHGDAVEMREPLPRPDAVGPLDREGAAAARLRAEPLVARLPLRGRRAARRRPRAPRARRHRRSARALGGLSAARRHRRLAAGVRHQVRVDLRRRVGRVLVERLLVEQRPRRATRACRGARSAAP